MTKIDLKNKAVIVTGAGSGLGRAMALALAEAGASVLALDVSNDRADETVKMASGLAGKIVPAVCDVRRTEDCARAVEVGREKLGGLTGLVNCAGLGMTYLKPNYQADPLRFWQADPDRWQDLIDVNVRGPFLLARVVTPHLLAQKWGRIVNVTTSFSTMTRGNNMPYGQSKAALEAASNSWSEDLEGTGVTCNVLIPGGAADTNMIPDESGYDRAKLINPAVMAAPVRWLMSDLSDGVSGRRFLGKLWDPNADPEDAIKASGAPVAWPELAAESARGRVPPGD